MTTKIRRTGGIQELDVWNAADALLLQGERPTIERVRAKLGRGSPNTVSPYLDAWFASLGARIKDPGAFSAPSQIPDPVSQAAQHFWQAALACARSEAEERVREREAALQAEGRDLAERERALQARDEVLQDAAKEAAARAHGAEERAERLQRDLGARNAAIAQLTTNLAAERASREGFERQLTSERQTYDAERAAADQRWTEQGRRLMLEVNQAREAAKQVQEKLAKLEEQVAEQAQRSRAEQSAAAQELALAREASERWQGEARQQRVSAERLQTELAALQVGALAREERLAAQVGQLQTQLGAALEQLRSKDEQHGAMLHSLVARTGARTGQARVRRRLSLARRK